MDIFTHSVFAALLYIFFLKEITFEFIFIAIIFSILPDLDIFLFPLKRIIKSNYLEHRGGSHSFVIGIIISAVASFHFSIVGNRSFFLSWLIGSIFWGLHISMDLLTTTKIPYLYPLSKKEHCFYVEKAGSLFTMLNSILFLIILGIMRLNAVNVIFYSLIINLYTYFFIFYYSYRILSKVLISSKLNSFQKYFPGILPIYYLIYDFEIETNKINLKIEKKSHFFKSKILENTYIVLNHTEMLLFEKGLELCKENYYFAKWTLFPVIIPKNGIFSVRFFFLETLVNGKTLYIQFDFDLVNQQLIGVIQRRGSIKLKS